jgi:hypothetical protein
MQAKSPALGSAVLTITQMHIALPTELHPFIELVLGDMDLQQRLAPIAEADAFVAEAVRVAAQHSITLDPAVMAGALRPDPLGLGRYAAAPIEVDAWPPQGWIPTRSVPSAGAPAFDWLWFGSRPLTMPFLEDEVRAAGAMPFNWLFRIRTSMQAVIAGATNEPHLPLQGLIFHMSRCGSTLLAQILAADPGNAVSSEPEPLDGVIQWARLAQVDAETAIPAIRAIVAALARDRGSGAKRHIIKLDAWHAFSLPLFRAAFPDVNWVHLYRDSVEVMVSTMQQPGVHTAPGTLPEEITGFAFDATMSHEDFAARVLARIGETVIANWDVGGGMLVAYPDIRDATPGRITAHFGLSPDDKVLALMTAAGKRDAKAPQQSFESDVVSKQAAATPAILAAANRWMAPVEQQLAHLARLQK